MLLYASVIMRAALGIVSLFVMASCARTMIDDRDCRSGESVRCRCEDGRIGAQTCEGGIYGVCRCAPPGPAACRPGESAGCLCSDGRSGTQVCDRTGVFDRCDCSTAPDAGPGGGDAGPDAEAPLDDGGCVGCTPGTWDAPVRVTDVVQHPEQPVLYASVPGSAPTHANEVVSIDARTGAVEWGVYVGSDPGPLAVSDDGTTLYVGLDGAAAVRRVDLETREAGLEFTLGNSSWHGPLYAGDMEVMPGSTEVLAVSTRRRGVSPDFGGVAIFDDGVRRPNMTPDHTGARVIEAASATRLYGFNNSSTEFGFRELIVDDQGVTEAFTIRDLFSGFRTEIDYVAGRVYGSDGVVVDPTIPRIVGSYAAQGPFAVASDADRVFFLTQETFGDVESLSVFEASTFRGTRTVSLTDRSWSNAEQLFYFAPDRFVVLLGTDRFGDAPKRLTSFRSPTAVGG